MRIIWALAWPAIMTFGLESLVGLIDTLMVGRLGAAAVAGVGVGTQILNGASTYSGATSVNNGTLLVSGTLNATNAVNINGGALEIGAAERLSDGAGVTMSGGTLRTAGFTESLGTLTLSGPATIDLGSGASILDFADSSLRSWTGSLSITNWSGLTNGGGTDQIFFGNSASGLQSNQIALISFVDPAGFAPGSYSATILANGEVVAVPEPASALMLCSGLGLLLAFYLLMCKYPTADLFPKKRR